MHSLGRFPVPVANNSCPPPPSTSSNTTAHLPQTHQVAAPISAEPHFMPPPQNAPQGRTTFAPVLTKGQFQVAPPGFLPAPTSRLAMMTPSEVQGLAAPTNGARVALPGMPIPVVNSVRFDHPQQGSSKAPSATSTQQQRMNLIEIPLKEGNVVLRVPAQSETLVEGVPYEKSDNMDGQQSPYKENTMPVSAAVTTSGCRLNVNTAPFVPLCMRGKNIYCDEFIPKHSTESSESEGEMDGYGRTSTPRSSHTTLRMSTSLPDLSVESMEMDRYVFTPDGLHANLDRMAYSQPSPESELQDQRLGFSLWQTYPDLSKWSSTSDDDGSYVTADQSPSPQRLNQHDDSQSQEAFLQPPTYFATFDDFVESFTHGAQQADGGPSEQLQYSPWNTVQPSSDGSPSDQQTHRLTRQILNMQDRFLRDHQNRYQT